MLAGQALSRQLQLHQPHLPPARVPCTLPSARTATPSRGAGGGQGAGRPPWLRGGHQRGRRSGDRWHPGAAGCQRRAAAPADHRHRLLGCVSGETWCGHRVRSSERCMLGSNPTSSRRPALLASTALLLPHLQSPPWWPPLCAASRSSRWRRPRTRWRTSGKEPLLLGWGLAEGWPGFVLPCPARHWLPLPHPRLHPTPPSPPRPQPGSGAGVGRRRGPRQPAGGPTGPPVDPERAAAAGGGQGARVTLLQQQPRRPATLSSSRNRIVLQLPLPPAFTPLVLVHPFD